VNFKQKLQESLNFNNDLYAILKTSELYINLNTGSKSISFFIIKSIITPNNVTVFYVLSYYESKICYIALSKFFNYSLVLYVN
jgi:hypothetical protein